MSLLLAQKSWKSTCMPVLGRFFIFEVGTVLWGLKQVNYKVSQFPKKLYYKISYSASDF